MKNSEIVMADILRRETKKLLPWQEEVFNSIINAEKTGDKLIVMTTPRMGKSFLFKLYEEYRQELARHHRESTKCEVYFDEFSSIHLDEEITEKLRKDTEPKHWRCIFISDKKKQMSEDFDESMGFKDIVRREE